MEIELFKKLSKYPFIHNFEFFDSLELRQNKSCIKCEKKDCLALLLNNTNETEYICSKGYNNILLITKEVKLILNGLIYSTNNVVPKGRKEIKQEWLIERDSIFIFIRKIQDIESYLSLKENDTTVKNFSIFHDFKTSMNIFFTCTQEIIDSLPGNSFEDKLNSSNKSYQDLYRALSLITSQLRMTDIVINPSSIIFGEKRLINIYKLFDKMKMLFEHLTIKKRDIAIKFIPAPYIPDVYCYESIEFIPLILLDNALKYSVPDSDIEIKLERSYNKITIIVKNIGPLVSDANIDKIFEKFYRDESAQTFSKEGIGVGLWIAQQILEAHESKLAYFKKPNWEGSKIGLNVFTFDLPIY